MEMIRFRKSHAEDLGLYDNCNPHVRVSRPKIWAIEVLVDLGLALNARPADIISCFFFQYSLILEEHQMALAGMRVWPPRSLLLPLKNPASVFVACHQR